MGDSSHEIRSLIATGRMVDRAYSDKRQNRDAVSKGITAMERNKLITKKQAAELRKKWAAMPVDLTDYRSDDDD
jgi:hypothetical protein